MRASFDSYIRIKEPLLLQRLSVVMHQVLDCGTTGFVSADVKKEIRQFWEAVSNLKTRIIRVNGQNFQLTWLIYLRSGSATGV